MLSTATCPVITVVIEVGFVHRIHSAGGLYLIAQSTVHSVSSSFSNRSPCWQNWESQTREGFGLTLFACCGNVLGNHRLLTALSSQIHYNTGCYASKSLWSAFCCSGLWFQTTVHFCAALSVVEQFVLFPLSDIFHWNTEQVLQKSSYKDKSTWSL